MKPDIVLTTPDPFDTLASSFSWRNVVSFLELTSEDFGSRLRLQITRKAYAVFVAQPGRRFFISLSIANQLFRLHFFDRSGDVHSRGYNIHNNADILVRILFTLVYALPEYLGYDTTITFSTVIAQMDPRFCRRRPTIQVDGKVYTIVGLLFNSEMIRGRATLCFVVEDAEGRRYVVKDSWTRVGWATTEEQMLNRISERGLTYGVPVLVAAWTVRVGDVDDSTATHRPGYLFPGGNVPPDLEIRIHRRLLLSPCGIPLTEFSCIQELLSVLIDIVEIHEILVVQCGILHRDISINNLLMYVCTHSWPVRQENKDPSQVQRLSERERVITDRNYRWGLLIDFDYARFVDGTVTGQSQGERTGTIPFMAIDLLNEYATQEGTVVHQPKHDLESVIYVFIWICVLYRHPTNPQGVPLSAQNTCLRAWTRYKTVDDVQSLASLKGGELINPVPVKHFTSYFKDLEKHAHMLYGALAHSHLPGNIEAPLTHDVVKDILLNAFFCVQEPAPTLECVRENLLPPPPGNAVKRRMPAEVVTSKHSRPRLV